MSEAVERGLLADAPGAASTVREIAQQPAVWREAAARAARAHEAVGPWLRDPAARVVLTGAGTSAFAGEVLAPGLRRRLRRRIDAVASTDLVSSPRECFAEDLPTLLVSFARSGDSPESVAAAELAEACLSEVAHLVLTCNPDGELARRYAGSDRAQVVLMPPEANDEGFAMTSSFTSLTLGARTALDPRSAAALADRLPTLAERVLRDPAGRAEEVARRGYQRVVYLGSGALKGLARESALKVLELTAGRVTAMGDSPLAFRHGPKAVLDPETLVVVYLSNDPYTRAYDLDLLGELRSTQGTEHVLALSADHGDLTAEAATWLLADAADLDDGDLALPLVLHAQLVALHASLALGLTPDDPFPSGLVNRVVQGVRIHPLDGRR